MATASEQASVSDELTTMVQNTIDKAIDEAIDNDKFYFSEISIISEGTIRTPILEESAVKEVETEDDDIKVPKYKDTLVNLVKRDIYHKGNLRRRQEGFYHPDTGQFIKHGIEIGFFETGEVESELSWYENKKHGDNIFYWPNGNQRGYFRYMFDKIVGRSVNWHQNGNIESVIHWSQGKQHGRTEFYSENGRLSGEVEYYDDLKHGIERIFYDNGKIRAFITWNMGAESGVETYWEPDGTLKQKIWWKDGVPVNAYKKTSADIKKKKDAAAATAAALKAARDKIKASKSSGSGTSAATIKSL